MLAFEMALQVASINLETCLNQQLEDTPKRAIYYNWLQAPVSFARLAQSINFLKNHSLKQGLSAYQRDDTEKIIADLNRIYGITLRLNEEEKLINPTIAELFLEKRAQTRQWLQKTDLQSIQTALSDPLENIFPWECADSAVASTHTTDEPVSKPAPASVTTAAANISALVKNSLFNMNGGATSSQQAAEKCLNQFRRLRNAF